MQKIIPAVLILLIIGVVVFFAVKVPAKKKACRGSATGSVELSGNMKFHYLLFPPKEPGPDSPLLVILHGRAERGNDNRKPADKIGCDVLERLSAQYNSWIFLPQCPSDRYWIPNPNKNFENFNLQDFRNTEILDSLRSYIIGFSMNYSVNRDRIYLIGHSMGGIAVWKLLYDNPGLFAGAIPVSTSCDPGSAVKYNQTGLWLVMGENDPFFSNDQVMDMYKALKDCGHNNAYLSLLDEKDHDVFRDVLSDENFMKWLFSQRRGNVGGEAGIE